MSDWFENFVEGTRTDPRIRTVSANPDGKVILDLGDRAKTVVIDQNTQTIQLLNKLVEINSGPNFKDLEEIEKIEAGYGVHVAATHDMARGYTAAQIDVQTDDGSVSPELQKLYEIAITGGGVGSSGDINLRLGAFSSSGTPSDAFVEICLDGKWSTDILRIEGPLAFELLGGEQPNSGVQLSDIANGEGGFKILGSARDDATGYSVSSAGDVNGDGIDDMIIGAPYKNTAGFFAGAAYVVFGAENLSPAGGTIDLDDVANGIGGFRIDAEFAQDNTGYSVSAAGDINGDGIDDLVVGAPRHRPDLGADAAGAAYVVYGGTGLSASGGTLELADIAAGNGGFKIIGQEGADRAGNSVASAGDINGDGFDDLIVGANHHVNGTKAGAAYVVFGGESLSPSGGTIHLDEISAGVGGFKIVGEANNNYAGQGVSSAGDVNGDGFDDLLIGAFGAQGRGAAYVVFGADNLSPAGGVVDLNDIAAGTGGFRVLGEVASDRAGYSVSAAGDVNGDGIDDLLIGAYAGGGGERGAAYVVYGQVGLTPDDGTIDLVEVAGGNGGFRILGESDRDFAGFSVSTAGDFNADGIDDLIIGAYANDRDGDEFGAAYLVFGNENPASENGTIDLIDVAAGNGGFKIFGEAKDDRAGFSVSSAGDVNHDGFDDLLVGAIYNDADGASGFNKGAAYVIFGNDADALF